jgi:hypothetical protein
MTTHLRNRLFVLFILLFPFMLFCGFLMSELAGPLPPLAPLPNPNGYNDLVKAGGMVSSNTWNGATLEGEQLRQTVSANAAALALARTAMGKPCQVPLQFSLPGLDRHLSNLADLKSLAQAFVAEGRWAEAEARYRDAASSYLDLIHLGNDSNRGGIVIDALLGMAMNLMGTAQLQKITGRLDAKTCCEAAITLETLAAQHPSWADVLQQEHAWSRRTFPGIRYRLGELLMLSSVRKAHQNAGQKVVEREKQTRQLTLELAARAYELEKGHRPASPADLVPDYLKAIPQDPFTGTNLVLTP